MNNYNTKFKQTEIGMIPKDWEEKKLGEEIELAYGKGLTENKRIAGVYPVFGSNGIVGFHNKALVKGPGIIIGRKGSVGEVKFSNKDFWPIDTTYYVKLKNEGNIFFWYYFLLTLKLNKMNSHSAVPGLNRDIVYELIKRIPKPEEQSAIAKILSDLDLKIELNQQMNKTLEAIGQAIFRHWFIDFEFPNDEEKPYKSAGGEMVFNEELGKEIPKGWELKCLKDFGNIICGKTPPKSNKEFFNGNIPFIKIPDMHNQLFIVNTEDSLTKDGENYQKNKTIPAKSICVSCIATVGLISLTSKNSQTNQQINSIIPSKEIYTEYLYYQLMSMSQILRDMGSGGSATLNINTTSFSNIPLLFPDKNILNKYHLSIRLLFDKILINQLEALNL